MINKEGGIETMDLNKLKEIQAVVFDMDGLMFDSERIWSICWEPALAKFGLPCKDGLSQAARGTTKAGSCDVLRRFYGEDCPAMGIVEELYRLAYEAFNKPVPKMPGLDELLAWLDEHHIPMAVASSSPMTVIEGHLEHWGLGHYFKAVISGEQLTRSKPAPDIFLLAARKLGTEPAKTMVLEDSYNGVRAGAAGGFVTVMVPDLSPATDEMRRIYACECASLHEVRRKLEDGEL